VSRKSRLIARKVIGALKTKKKVDEYISEYFLEINLDLWDTLYNVYSMYTII